MTARRRRPDPAISGDAHAVQRLVLPVLIGLLIGVAVLAGIASGYRWARSPVPDATASGAPNNAQAAVLGACNRNPTCFPESLLPARAQQLLALIITERAKAGCRPVTLDTRLIQAAQLSTGSLISSRARTPHVDSAQRTPQDRAEFTGYHGRVVETIAVGLPTPQIVMQTWLDEHVDPSIRARLDNCASVAIGIDALPARVGSTYGTGVWVVELGQPETAP
jgi:hypothetical protein